LLSPLPEPCEGRGLRRPIGTCLTSIRTSVSHGPADPAGSRVAQITGRPTSRPELLLQVRGAKPDGLDSPRHSNGAFAEGPLGRVIASRVHVPYVPHLPQSPKWPLTRHFARSRADNLRHDNARRRGGSPRCADRRPARRPPHHDALRPGPHQPRPPPQLHPRRLHGLRHLTHHPRHVLIRRADVRLCR